MVIAIDTKSTETITLKCDKGNPTPTIFVVRKALTSRVVSGISNIQQMVSKGDIMLSGSEADVILRNYVVSWSNLRDSNGAEVPPDAVLLDVLPLDACGELVARAMKTFRIDGDDRKNSDLPPSG